MACLHTWSITVTSNGCAAISNQRPHHYFFNSLLIQTQKKLQRRITGPLCTESISDPNKRLAFHITAPSCRFLSVRLGWLGLWCDIHDTGLTHLCRCVSDLRPTLLNILSPFPAYLTINICVIYDMLHTKSIFWVLSTKLVTGSRNYVTTGYIFRGIYFVIWGLFY